MTVSVKVSRERSGKGSDESFAVAEATAREWTAGAIARSCQGKRSDAVIVIPPFGPRHSPALGPHVLQAVCAVQGLSVALVYANQLLALLAGEADLAAVEALPTAWLAGERIFAAQAHGLPPMGADRGDGLAESARALRAEGIDSGPGVEAAWRVQFFAAPLVSGVAGAIAGCRVRVVGGGCSYEQINSVLAILRQVKLARPDCVAVVGGANCSGPMADGIARLAPWVDHVFSGDSERVFGDWMAAGGAAGSLPRIVRSQPLLDLDGLPIPDFTDFLDQANSGSQSFISWETSRGCRKAMAAQCRFCGLNAGDTVFRQRAPESALAGFKTLGARHPGVTVAMTDSAMPGNYFEDLLPSLGQVAGLGKIHYEQRPGLGLRRVCRLKKAGVVEIQAGIEALSEGLLKKMDKGSTLEGNVETLRLCRSTGIAVRWNMLCCLPGDSLEDYEGALGLCDLLSHLHPPSGLMPLALCRFSPFHSSPEKFDISNLAPLPSYSQVFPECFDPEQVCYFFRGDYPCESRDEKETLKALHAKISAWRLKWNSGISAPVLHIRETVAGYELTDSRGLPGRPQFSAISRERAAASLGGEKSRIPIPEEDARWAVEAATAFVSGGRLVPLATARPATIAEFTGEILS